MLSYYCSNTLSLKGSWKRTLLGRTRCYWSGRWNSEQYSNSRCWLWDYTVYNNRSAVIELLVQSIFPFNNYSAPVKYDMISHECLGVATGVWSRNLYVHSPVSIVVVIQYARLCVWTLCWTQSIKNTYFDNVYVNVSFEALCLLIVHQRLPPPPRERVNMLTDRQTNEHSGSISR